MNFSLIEGIITGLDRTTQVSGGGDTMTTGWMTTFKRQGWAMMALIGFGLVGLVFTWIFPLFAFMPLFSAVVVFLIMRADARIRRAHIMLNE